MDSFTTFAEYYDSLYYKPEVYEQEAAHVQRMLEKHKLTDNQRILDVACGTGTHIKFFMPKYEVYGLDISEAMLRIARNKYPNIQFFQADMVDFKLGCRFGAILCLYGSIGVVQTKERLVEAIHNFAAHLASGGILVLVPWSTQEDFREQLVTDRVKTKDRQIVRMEKVGKTDGTQVEITYHYLIGDNRTNSIEYYTGKHPPIGLFSRNEYEDAIKRANLDLVETYIGNEMQMGIAYICRKGTRRSDLPSGQTLNKGVAA